MNKGTVRNLCKFLKLKFHNAQNKLFKMKPTEVTLPANLDPTSYTSVYSGNNEITLEANVCKSVDVITNIPNVNKDLCIISIIL